jgi:uncharacterized damage-inducible protein DinB
VVSAFDVEAYGDPCRSCGFRWDVHVDAARSLVAGSPERVALAVAAASGRERSAGRTWSVGAYVLHMADNLRVWAERLTAASAGHPAVAGYDQDALATARNYEAIALPAATWSLQRAVTDWLSAVDTAAPGVEMVHPLAGRLSLDAVVRWNAHDVAHHEWDIAVSLDGAGG